MLVLAVVAGTVVPRSVPSAEATASEAAATAGSLLVIPNAGQFDPAVRFQVRGAGSILWVTDAAVWLTALAPEPRVDRVSPDRADPHGARLRTRTRARHL